MQSWMKRREAQATAAKVEALRRIQAVLRCLVMGAFTVVSSGWTDFPRRMS